MRLPVDDLVLVEHSSPRRTRPTQAHAEDRPP